MAMVTFNVPGETMSQWMTGSNMSLNVGLVLGSTSNAAASNSSWDSYFNYTSNNVQVYGQNSNNFLANHANSIFVTGMQL